MHEDKSFSGQSSVRSSRPISPPKAKTPQLSKKSTKGSSEDASPKGTGVNSQYHFLLLPGLTRLIYSFMKIQERRTGSNQRIQQERLLAQCRFSWTRTTWLKKIASKEKKRNTCVKKMSFSQNSYLRFSKETFTLFCFLVSGNHIRESHSDIPPRQHRL